MGKHARKELIPHPASRFLKVRCNKCKNEQMIFNKSASKVDCLVCGELIALPLGGKTEVKAKIIEVLE